MAYTVPFGQSQAFAAKYWYERLQYTWGPQTANTGTTPVFAVNQINKTQVPMWFAALVKVAATSNANVALEFSFDRRTIPALANQGQTNALPAGTGSLIRSEPVFMPAVNNIALSLKNSGSAVSSFQLNYQVAMRRLTVADKLMLGITQFTQDERDALNDKSIDVQGLVEKGTSPIPIEAQIERTYQNRLLYTDVRLVHVDASTSDTAFLTIRSSESGQDTFMVLRSIAIEGGVPVVVSVDRDEDYNYMGVNGAAFVDAEDSAFDVFVPALNYLTFHIQANTPQTAVPIRVVVWHIKMSNIMRVRFGLVRRGEIPDNTYLRAIAGVV